MIQYTERLRSGDLKTDTVENYVKAIEVVGNNRFEKIPDNVPVKIYYDFDYNDFLKVNKHI